MSKNTCTAILGSQWGDEGKGKLVDILGQSFNIICRFNGGANAGHTIVVGNKKYKMNLLPSGIVSKETINVIGNGVVVHLPHLLHELEQLDKDGIDYKNRLFISDRAHVLFDFHQLVDAKREAAMGKTKIGTTNKGIGPAYSTKMQRNGVRMGELKHWKQFEEHFKTVAKEQMKFYGFEYDIDAELKRYQKIAQQVTPMIIDSVHFINKQIEQGKKVLLEGANAAMLDIDFGTYPYVTSSSATIGGACIGLGISPKKVGDVIGVVKAYTTRVGSGPFPTELLDKIGDTIRDIGGEYGTTTGRPRRCGWLDLVVVKYTHMLNEYSSLCLTKLDVLSGLEELKIGVKYKLNNKELESFPGTLEDLKNVEVVYETMPGWKTDISKVREFGKLPKNAQKYVLRIEEILGVPIKWIGVGPGREDIIIK